MPALTAAKTTIVSLPVGQVINITGIGEWDFIALNPLGGQIDSGTYVNEDVIGVYPVVANVQITAAFNSSLSYNVATPSSGQGQTTASNTGELILDAGLTQINVTCTAANTNYQAYSFPLTATNFPAESMLEFECQIHWAGLAASTKTMLIGIGRTFANAMTGSASNPDGALILSRTNGAANNVSEFKVRVLVGTSRDTQVFIYASNGDENTGTSSALPIGATTLSADDCNLYLGLKSATAGEVLRCSARLVKQIKAPA